MTLKLRVYQSKVKDLEMYKLWHAHPVFLFYFIITITEKYLRREERERRLAVYEEREESITVDPERHHGGEISSRAWRDEERCVRTS